jgi:hypothetical protein
MSKFFGTGLVKVEWYLEDSNCLCLRCASPEFIGQLVIYGVRFMDIDFQMNNCCVFEVNDEIVKAGLASQVISDYNHMATEGIWLRLEHNEQIGYVWGQKVYFSDGASIDSMHEKIEKEYLMIL